MAKNSVNDWDATAGNNTDVGGISIAEGMSPSDVNNAMREMMKQWADVVAGTTALSSINIDGGSITGVTELAASGANTDITSLSGVTSMNGSSLSGRRNFVTNGAMAIAQRGTETGVTVGYGGPDRYQFIRGGTAVVTLSQDSDVPSGQGFANSMKIDVTTGDSSMASTDYAILRQRFEGYNLQPVKKGTSNAEQLTVSFWIKTTITGTYICELFDNDNSRHVAKSYTVSSADTWEKKTITFPADTTGALDDDANYSMQLSFFLAAGSDFSSGTLATSWASYDATNAAVGQVNAIDSASNDIYFTGIQLELGDTATDFEFRSYGQDLTDCQRYYFYQSGALYGGAYGGSGFAGATCLPTTMRAVPTLSYSTVRTTSNLNAYPSINSAQYVMGDTSPYVTGLVADAEL